ncbi:hypothetical protein [Synechococcus sp. W70.1]|uniref:hypothetical protein n=1 Tax=Synechococcus sp. W70.1 TaxID=2964534 RepID=UPI0039C1065B
MRHQPSLGFAVSAARAWVEEVNASGHSLKARLEQAIAECAYALAQQQPGSLVVVVSNDRPLVGRIQELRVSNLCAISLAELNRWVHLRQWPGLWDGCRGLPFPPRRSLLVLRPDRLLQSARDPGDLRLA